VSQSVRHYNDPPPNAQPLLPRLGVRHLLLWMAVIGVMLGTSPQVLSPETPWPFVIRWLIRRLASSTSLAVGLLVVWEWAWHFQWRRLQPGHWFCLIELVGYVATNVLSVIQSSVTAGYYDLYYWLSMVKPFWTIAAQRLAYYNLQRDRSVWRWSVGCSMLFLLLTWSPVWFPTLFEDSALRAAGIAWLDARFLTESLATVAWIAVPLLVSIGLILDYRQRCPRDWGHYVGAGAKIAEVALPMMETASRVLGGW
jgi:hypothetical protein